MARDPYKVCSPLELPAGSPGSALRRHVGHPAASIVAGRRGALSAAADARTSSDRLNRAVSDMLLAGDLGGTKTLLGLFRQTGTARPDVVVTHEFATLDFPAAADILTAFLREDRRRRGHRSTPPASASRVR